MLRNLFWLCFDLFLAKVLSGDEDDEDDSHYHYGEYLYPSVVINQKPGELKFKIMHVVHTELHIKEVSGYLCSHLVKWLELSHLQLHIKRSVYCQYG